MIAVIRAGLPTEVFVIPQHDRPDGQWCGWSGVHTINPDGDCPDQCLARAAMHPVVYAPSGHVIGHARTEAGAIAHAAGSIPKLPCERWTARLAERLGDGDRPAGLAWFVGPQLIQGGAR